ncbi:MAG: marine proteobacterial sortase target protein [Gammaproteobacteria bacterium]|nr:marine proteobacterial sortase target protein [Gammaproteobacteria bacterium]
MRQLAHRNDTRHRHRHRHRYQDIAQCIALLLVAALVSIEPLEASAEVSGQVTMNEVTAGEILFETATPGRYLPAMQLDSRADITVSGFVATVEVVQRFRNATRDWAEGVYVFPLPDTAAVNAMELRIGERVIVGEIREKQQARREYQQAKREGRKAGLVEQPRPNMFTTAVANIAPGQEIEVRLTYVERVAYEGGRFSLRFPMTITPRYIPGAPRPAGEEPMTAAPGSGWAVNTDQVTDAAEITPHLEPRRPTSEAPINPIELSVALDPGLPLADISSAYHDIHVARQGGLYDVSLTAGRVPMDRDFELTWQTAVGSEPAAALFTQELDGSAYALAMILPPTQVADAARLPRETVLIIDTSGSMGGEPIRQARAALELALSRLAPGDRFDVIAFNDRPTSLFGDSRPVDENTLAEARRFVKRLSAGGGTEMMSALNLAFAGDPENSIGLLRQVVFITDGAVGNAEALFKAISDGLAERRLFTVGIGSAPNSHFMRKAAQFGRGTFTFIGKPTEVEQKMDELFTRLEKPMLRNVVLDWPDADAVVEPDPIPDLYDGQPIIVTARLNQSGGEVRAAGETSNGHWEQTLTLDTAAVHSGVATVWARDRINGIEDRIALEGETDGLRKQILDLALNHKLVSRFTSFVAIEKQVSRPKSLPGQSHNVPNLRPAGQSPQPFAYPQTATSATEAFWLGLLGMIAALLLWLRVYNLPQADTSGSDS